MYTQTFERIKLEKKNQSRQLDSLKHIILDRKSARPAGDLPSTRVLIRGETVDMVDLPYVHTSPAPIGLILVPTRELGQQIASEARRLCELHPGYEVAVFVGGLRIEGDRKKVDYMINGAAKMNSEYYCCCCSRCHFPHGSVPLCSERESHNMYSGPSTRALTGHSRVQRDLRGHQDDGRG